MGSVSDAKNDAVISAGKGDAVTDESRDFASQKISVGGDCVFLYTGDGGDGLKCIGKACRLTRVRTLRQRLLALLWTGNNFSQR